MFGDVDLTGKEKGRLLMAFGVGLCGAVGSGIGRLVVEALRRRLGWDDDDEDEDDDEEVEG